MWHELLDGRWQLIDRVQRECELILIGTQNHNAERFALSKDERRVAQQLGLGLGTKQIAHLLGVTSSTIGLRARQVQRKLGLASRCELASAFAPHALPSTLSLLHVRGRALLVGRICLTALDQPCTLSPAERTVARLLIAGASNADIARTRGSAIRTVANQVQSIFRKLEVRSRTELAAHIVRAH